MAAKSSKHPGHYQVKISLIDSPLPIWRRLVIDGSMSLSMVHEVLQIAMGWWSYHLYEFNHAGNRYGNMQWAEEDPDLNDADKTDLATVLKKAGDSLIYTYDFGDGWQHHVMLEKVIKSTADLQANSAFCTQGKRACPPEDCGGPGGFEGLITAVEDSLHPSHSEVIAWVGDCYDPDAFDIRGVNFRLGEWAMIMEEAQELVEHLPLLNDDGGKKKTSKEKKSTAGKNNVIKLTRKGDK